MKIRRSGLTQVRIKLVLGCFIALSIFIPGLPLCFSPCSLRCRCYRQPRAEGSMHGLSYRVIVSLPLRIPGSSPEDPGITYQGSVMNFQPDFLARYDPGKKLPLFSGCPDLGGSTFDEMLSLRLIIFIVGCMGSRKAGQSSAVRLVLLC